MNVSLIFIRTLFFLLSILFVTLYMSSSYSPYSLIGGLGLGSLLGCALIGFDIFFRKCNIRSFNIATLGLFFGYLMGQALLLIFDAIMDISYITLQPNTLEIVKISLFLFGLYLGTIMMLRSADELYVSIPFVRLSPSMQKKKDFILDLSCLSDSRLIDFINTGLLDNQVIIPKFLLQDIYVQAETEDESGKNRAKRIVDVIHQLEQNSKLALRFSDTDFPEIKDLDHKCIRLAKLLDANILSSDNPKTDLASVEGVKFITLHNLSVALKPITRAGEIIKIRVQRYGKEPRQGIGYLDDGTMVVINGGGDYLGDIIEAVVLSVKHTSSGRMIFCNACDAEDTWPSSPELGPLS